MSTKSASEAGGGPSRRVTRRGRVSVGSSWLQAIAMPPRSPLARLGWLFLVATPIGAAFLAGLLILDSPEPWVQLVPAGAALLSLAVALAVAAAVMHVVGTVLAKYERGMARERILRRAGAALVTAADRDSICAAAVDAALDLVGDARKAGVTLWLGPLEAMVAVAAAGERAAEASQARVDFSALRALVGAGLGERLLAVGDESALLPIRAAFPFDPEAGALYLAPLYFQQEIRGVLAVVGEAALPRDWADGFQTLAAEVALALESAALTEHVHQRRSEERFRVLVQNASDVIAIVGADGRLSYLSPSAERVWGYRADMLLGRDLFDLVHPMDRYRSLRLFGRVLARDGATLTTEFRVRGADGSWRHSEVTAHNLLAEPSVAGIVTTCRDADERKAFEEQLARQALYDTLTGLPNRALFVDRLRRALAQAGRRRATVAVMLVDLDRFKVINDSLGHAAGDQLLVATSRRLEGCLRPGDTLARFGADEFMVLLEGVGDRDDATQVAERISRALDEPFTIEGHEVFATASIGIALAAAEPTQPDQLLRDADVALHQAKSTGRARHLVFDASIDVSSVKRLDFETDLRRAIGRGELRLAYQPELDLRTGRIVGVEALVRWAHPERGLVPPSDFVPLAEDNGLIVPIGRWVLHQACVQARTWHARYRMDPPLVMSVNLSARQLREPDLGQQIAATVAEAGMDPAALKLEITESVLMEDAEAALSTLHALQQLGIRSAIDDFGTGYSSLSYLRRLVVDTLKIDRSFVSGLDRDDRNLAIVRAVASLGHALDMTITAEGIETPTQLDRLRSVGCDRGQGYYFSRPLSPEACADLLASNLAHHSRSA